MNARRTPSLWRAFSAFVAALSDNEAELTGDVVRLLRRVDAEIKALAQSGADALTRPLSLDLVKQLVDAAREHGNDSPDIKQLGEAIEQEPAEERVAISKREAIHTAAAALREELASVKDALDLFVRSDDAFHGTLLQLAAPLKQIGSTLSISRLRKFARGDCRSGRGDQLAVTKRQVRRRIAARRRVRAAAGR